jgi:hypothetical protein
VNGFVQAVSSRLLQLDEGNPDCFAITHLDGFLNEMALYTAPGANITT